MMTDTEIVDAIIRYKLRVHPSGRYDAGWTAAVSQSDYIAWNRPTMRLAVEEVVQQICDAVMKSFKMNILTEAEGSENAG